MTDPKTIEEYKALRRHLIASLRIIENCLGLPSSLRADTGAGK
jgi:hypothetical protein